MTKQILAGFSVVVVCAMIPGSGHAQVATTPRIAVGIGSTRGSALGYIGISNVRCNCTFNTDDDGTRTFTFRSNPVVLGVYEDSPADGSLERGDTITAIDGYPLTIAEGGRRFANIRAGQKLTLSVARGAAHMTFVLTASDISFGDVRAFGSRAPVVSGSTWGFYYPAEPAIPAAPAIPATPATPAAPGFGYGRAHTAVRVTPVAPVAPVAPVPAVAGTPPVAPVPPLPLSPTGWFGFSLRCSECGWEQSRDDDSPVWESSTAPEISMISRDGPAARAGLLAGDKLTHVNGVSILTRTGARAFGRVRPGEKVRLTVLRNGRSLTQEVTLATRPELRAAIAAVGSAPRPTAMKRELRYTGQLDNVSVEVWSSAGPTIDRNADTITITVGTSVIRLKAR